MNKIFNIKNIIIFILVSFLLFLIFYKLFVSNTNFVFPSCYDGIDNNGDGFIDYPEDKNCKNEFDKFEISLVPFGVFLFIILPLSILVIYYFYNKNEKKNIPTDDLLPEPVPSNRAYELAISDFLRNKARDIPAKLIEEKDNFIRLEPLDPNIIIEENRLPDKNKATGEYFQYSFIFVNYGLFAGPHLLVYSLSKGEEYLKGGIERFESGKHRNNWSKENRNYNMSSPVSENQRLELLKIDAIREGDKDILEEINALNKISIPKESAFVDDMDEDEYREKMRLNALNNMPKKKKKIKPNTQQIQPNLNEEGVEQ